MLTIDTKQQAVFEKEIRQKQVIPELCQHLRDKHAKAVAQLNDDQLNLITEKSVCSAEALGLTSKNDIYSFVSLDMDLFPGFYTHPAVQAFFKDAKPDSPTKMIDLFTSVPFEVWNQVKMRPVDG